MKIFSSIIAFAMVFACLSIACADIAPPPRPHNQGGFIDADIDNDGKLSLEFEFPYDCSYKYRLVDGTGAEIFSGKGTYNAGDTVQKSADLKLSIGRNFFKLKIETSDIKAQTRFGTKARRDKNVVTKTLVVTKNLYGKRYDLRIYDDERD
ncbi:MAG: hypothetical protein IJ774_07760 [Selenomonadaceae bacterium]|nr:hypothetical protein [Selenomonadaceae bacterium]